MGNKLFVGGLSWNTTSDELRAAFEACCSVEEASVIADRDTGRSRGFGFVTVRDSSQLQAAIQQMDGTMLDGRALRVNEANDRKPANSRY
jgi:RNA recognition motif-containing protein